MAHVLKDRVRESTTTIGNGPIALAGASGGYQRFRSVLAIGDTTFYAIVLPGGAWETGLGTYTALDTLTRTSVLESSNSNTGVNFPAGTKDVFICLPAAYGNALKSCFNAGTLMLFQQTNAPVYWTKQVTHNDKALRVVSGTASSGGATAFSSQFNNTVGTNSTTLTVAQMPSHTHNALQPTQSRNDGTSTVSLFAFAASSPTTSTGGDGAHNHTITINVQYVDLIIASKD